MNDLERALAFSKPIRLDYAPSHIPANENWPDLSHIEQIVEDSAKMMVYTASMIKNMAYEIQPQNNNPRMLDHITHCLLEEARKLALYGEMLNKLK